MEDFNKENNPEDFENKVGLKAILKRMLKTPEDYSKKIEKETEEGQFNRLKNEKTMTLDELAKLDELKKKKFPDGINN